MSTDSPAGDLGVLDRSGPQPCLRYERRLSHAPETVWLALTEPEHLAAWFPTTIDGERVQGASLVYRFPEELAIAPMEGRVLAIDPPRLLELHWGPDTLRFDLHRDGEATRLVFTVTLEAITKAARDGAGWHVCLEELAFDLAGETDRVGMDMRWRAVHPAYVARLGPDGAVDGPPQEWEDAYGPAD
ncbi:MAG TPA: SRPBCC domain-containing protein [Solirubrobacteraceae bacterium]|jgi:uncharacterized protein YndB with AHSA1/START domain|nr:SRPBCC domain-containing protein [Solirubrobacteraceae bacterium]